MEKDSVKSSYSSTEREIRRFSKSKWMQVRFLPTPGLINGSLFSGPYSIPLVRDWRFSPSGRIGVSVVEGCGHGFDVLVLDVHNKLWYGNSIKKAGMDFRNVFTYHMLDETNVVVVELLANSMVLQHIINLNLETREAEVVQTVIHEFRLRYPVDDPMRAVWTRHQTEPRQHVPISVKGNYYTALISSSDVIDGRRLIFLVPRDPLNLNIQPMEFWISTELTTANEAELIRLTGPAYLNSDFCPSGVSSAGLLHLTPLIALRDRLLLGMPPMFCHVLLGVYLTINVSKLIDIHDKHIDEMDQMELDQDQVDAMKLITHPFVQLVECVIGFDCGLHGTLVFLEPLFPDQTKRSYYLTCHVLESKRTLQIKTTRSSWLNLHPCGALLQFTVSPLSRLMYVRVASIYQLSLAAIVNSKLIFQPNRPIAAVEGLHDMVFDGLKPIPLDEIAQRALGTFTEYSKLLRNQQKLYKKKQPIQFTILEQPRPMRTERHFLEGYHNRMLLAFGVSMMFLAVLQFYVIHNYL